MSLVVSGASSAIKSMQRGSVSGLGSSGNITVAAVDLEKSVVVAHTYDGTFQCPRAVRFTSATNLAWVGAGNGVGRIDWQVIEYV